MEASPQAPVSALGGSQSVLDDLTVKEKADPLISVPRVAHRNRSRPIGRGAPNIGSLVSFLPLQGGSRVGGGSTNLDV